MTEITQRITPNVSQLNRFPPILVKQYDSGARTITATIMDGKTQLDVDAGADVLINAKRPDGEAKSFAGSVNADGTVTVPINYWMTTVDGSVKCDISIVGSDTMLTTATFELCVQYAANGDGTVSQDDNVGILVDLITKCNDIEAVEAARVKAEAARVEAENSRVSAESSRASAESARVKAETSRADAETKRASAESSRASAETSRANAESARVTAENARVTAENARASAETSRADAESKRVSAESSRASAESKRVTAENGRVSAENARVEAENARVTAENERASHEDSRLQSEANAKASAEAAATSASNAKTSEGNASTSASNAATSESNAKSSASAAATSAANAKTSEGNASTSASNASSSASTATTQANTATSKASAAATSASNASKSESSAAASATAAATSEKNAAASEQTCLEYLEQVKTVTTGAQGYYTDEAALNAAVPIGEDGWWAINGETDSIWVWDSDTSAWVDSHDMTELGDYYTRTQVDSKVATATSKTYTFWVDVSGWSGSDGNYSCKIYCPDMTASTQLSCIELTDTYKTSTDAVTAFQTWSYLNTAANYVYFYSATKPTATFAVTAIVVK